MREVALFFRESAPLPYFLSRDSYTIPIPFRTTSERVVFSFSVHLSSFSFVSSSTRIKILSFRELSKIQYLFGEGKWILIHMIAQTSN